MKEKEDTEAADAGTPANAVPVTVKVDGLSLGAALDYLREHGNLGVSSCVDDLDAAFGQVDQTSNSEDELPSFDEMIALMREAGVDVSSYIDEKGNPRLFTAGEMVRIIRGALRLQDELPLE